MPHAADIFSLEYLDEFCVPSSPFDFGKGLHEYLPQEVETSRGPAQKRQRSRRNRGRSERSSKGNPKESRQGQLAQEQLGGFVFVCSNETVDEAMDRQLFGLPSSHRESVSHIRPGLLIFLYNYNTHLLYGVFEACSFGGLNIEPDAFTHTSKKGAAYPAQVRVRLRAEMPPLPEADFRRVMDHYAGPKFRLELSHEQTFDVLRMFNALSMGHSLPALPATSHVPLPSTPFPPSWLVAAPKKKPSSATRQQRPPRLIRAARTAADSLRGSGMLVPPPQVQDVLAGPYASDFLEYNDVLAKAYDALARGYSLAGGRGLWAEGYESKGRDPLAHVEDLLPDDLY